MKKIFFTLAMAMLFVANASAQITDRAVAANSFWDNWHVQLGLDMALQNPHGYDFAEVFPNGKSFGLNAALGKDFTPEVGVRANLNWENGIRLFENGHAYWLAPFEEVGKNMDKGGYVSMVGDFIINLHNIFRGYDADRKWNAYVFPRAGLAYNFGVEKGTPLIGFGFGCSRQMNEKYIVFADLAYQGISSGFTGCEENTKTGTGSSSNGYFNINVGVQFNLGKSTFRKIK